ncbi:MAG: NADH-quinone oxidoreductase subunit L [Candidatus Tectomicrobia bacterium]|nr:NADH-quinone oxidoreductase subunit L [Candidatus Tectomicrobia bacterium]
MIDFFRHLFGTPIVYVGLVVLFPALGALINGSVGYKLSERNVARIGCWSIGLSFLVACLIYFDLLSRAGHSIIIAFYPWVVSGSLHVNIEFLVDPLSTVMILVVSGVGLLIHIYSIGYMHGDAGFARYFAYLNLFVTFMLTLVLAGNFLMMFVGWEGVGLCSYLLIGFWYERRSASDAGKKAFIVNRIGDFGFLLGVLLIFATFGSLDFHAVFAAAPRIASEEGSLLITVITLLLFMGTVGKSAQVPLYVWLPDAMEGPTPVSALIHAATMVTAGVYMIARCATLYALAPFTSAVVALVGAFTAIFAASIALTNNDIKRVLAYSTISQLGYMVMAMGVGAYVAGMFHLVTHAFFKALLFLGAGSVMHALGGEQDLRKMGGLFPYIWRTGFLFWIGTLAIAGIPPFAGFWSKDEILAGAFSHGLVGIIVGLIGLMAVFMTAFYMFRLVYLAFHGEIRVDDEKIHHLHESPPSMLVPMAGLALLSIVAGLFFGVPPEGGLIHKFLEPVFSLHAVEGEVAHHGFGFFGALLMLISIVVAAGGWFTARLFYIQQPGLPVRLANQYSHLFQLLVNRYRIDEVYDDFVVNPIKKFSIFLWNIFDAIFIDGVVDGLGAVVVHFSGALRRLQSGHVKDYALSIVIGVFVIVWYYLW